MYTTNLRPNDITIKIPRTNACSSVHNRNLDMPPHALTIQPHRKEIERVSKFGYLRVSLQGRVSLAQELFNLAKLLLQVISRNLLQLFPPN